MALDPDCGVTLDAFFPLGRMEDGNFALRHDDDLFLTPVDVASVNLVIDDRDHLCDVPVCGLSRSRI